MASQAREFLARPAWESYPKYAYDCSRCEYAHVSTKPPERATLSRGGRSKSRQNRRRFGKKNG